MAGSIKKSKKFTLSNLPSGSAVTQNDSLDKIQNLMAKESAKEEFLGVQEEIEALFLETIKINWDQMSPEEKKSAIKLGCLVQGVRKNLQSSFEEGIQ